jgi:uncharacterized membrane protein (DUF4010 family)
MQWPERAAASDKVNDGRMLSRTEWCDALLLAGAIVIVLPLLPNARISWLFGINPYRLWGLVIVLMAVQAAGHIALRLAGPAMGLALSGLASGFISSTATIAAMGARSRREPGQLAACVGGALWSNVATFTFLFVITAVVAPGSVAVVAPALGTGLAGAALVSLASLRAARAGAPAGLMPPGRHAVNLGQAIAFALILTAAISAVNTAQQFYGPSAVAVGAALTGLIDVHAAVGSALALSEPDAPGQAGAMLLVLIALSANTLAKLIAAALSGGPRFTLRLGAGLLVILAAAWAPYGAMLVVFP